MDTLRWLTGEECLELLDQTKLPAEITYIRCSDYRDVASAIKCLAVRGAPAIGAAAAYGLVLAAYKGRPGSKEEFLARVEDAARELAATRPTAVNLSWALTRLLRKARAAITNDPEALRDIMLAEAHTIFHEDVSGNRRIGEYGQVFIPREGRVLTHCNAGALATAGYGTALGVIRAARDAGKKVSVYADETRPLLQGARLTALELLREDIPVTLITDNMAGFLMAKGMVDLVIVGADRITANGDVANKIGTYGLAVMAKAHNIPFYVAAPVSTVDLSLDSGDEIPIEERDHSEVTHHGGRLLAPAGVKVWNPAFDVTPHSLVTAIITDRGVARPPYSENLKKIILQD
ncbi:S-methyl-5-thioribose-1-phosphate isomerase [Pelotomaculum propionicicum]|uniref:S-methyl-5-thioribose-1-phosphate isomerase n=1 Tax=Pelotomaculum propionicicum TaxID=258475 RepID=UPI003B7ED7CE